MRIVPGDRNACPASGRFSPAAGDAVASRGFCRSGRGGRQGRLAAAAGHLLPLLDGHEDFAGLRAVVGADDAVLGHEVDQPGGPAVADAQRPLQERNAAAALADHHVDGRLVELVAVC